MTNFQPHFGGLFLTTPNNVKPSPKATSEISVALIPKELAPVLSQLNLPGGSILAFLLVLCFLVPALTSLVKAIKE
jgi:hypothetical protein